MGYKIYGDSIEIADFEYEKLNESITKFSGKLVLHEELTEGLVCFRRITFTKSQFTPSFTSTDKFRSSLQIGQCYCLDDYEFRSLHVNK